MAVAGRYGRRRRFFVRVVDAVAPAYPSKAPWHVTIPVLGFRHIKLPYSSRDSSQSFPLIIITFSHQTLTLDSASSNKYICPSPLHLHTYPNNQPLHHNGQDQQRRQLRLRDGPGSHVHRLQGGQQAGRQGQQCQHRHPPLGRQGRCR